MSRQIRRTPKDAPSAFNKGTVVNLLGIFGGLILSGFVYVTGNWYIYGNEIQRHDTILSKLSDTVTQLGATVAVLSEQNKEVARTLERINGIPAKH